MKQEMWDVIVVGAGPSGSAAAKRCAEYGLKTLILEKQKLPRHKVCTGALMCSMAQNIVKEVFGELPREVMTTPAFVRGFIVYSPGFEGRINEHRMPLTWRDDLDFWMNGIARKAGAELWENARVEMIMEEATGYTVKVHRNGQNQEIKGKFIIGADGGNSIVRKSIFPDFKPTYVVCTQDVWETSLNLDKSYIHWYVFLPDRFIFEVNHKTWKGATVTVLDANGRPGEMAKRDVLVNRATEYMAKELGFDRKAKHLWTDGCLDAAWVKQVFNGTFKPARGNILLAGDSSGIKVPVTAEGIGTGIRAGLMAANAANKASHTGVKAEGIYLAELESLISELKKIIPPTGYLAEQAKKGAGYMLDAYRNIYEVALDY